MERSAFPRARVIFLAIFLLSVPLLVLGSLSDARLMPGLPVSALMFVCTAVVAFWVAWRSGGTAAMRALFGRLIAIRCARHWTWHVVSALLFPGVLGFAYAVMRGAHMSLPLPHVAWFQAPVLFALFFVAASGEEIAWSATLLEPLQEQHGALGAGLAIGVFSAVWHVIPFYQVHPSASWILGQCLFIVAFRVLIAWLYNVSGHSLFASVVCHASFNTAWQLFPNQGSGYDPWIAAAITWTIALGVVAVYGASTLSGRQ